MHNPTKPRGMFTLDERVELIEASVAQSRRASRVVVVHRARRSTPPRRSASTSSSRVCATAGDFEVEQQMAHTNYAVTGVRTVYLPCKPDLVFISSRFIREIASTVATYRHWCRLPCRRPCPPLRCTSPADDRAMSMSHDDRISDGQTTTTRTSTDDIRRRPSSSRLRRRRRDAACAAPSTSSPPRRRCRCRRRRASTATRSSSCSRRRSTACPTSCARRGG